jgi:hypothetical protein
MEQKVHCSIRRFKVTGSDAESVKVGKDADANGMG